MRPGLKATDRTEDEAARAERLLSRQIIRIDAALTFMKQRKRAYQPEIYRSLHDALKSHRAKAEWYLAQPNHGGKTALGMMGANGRGPLLDRTISSVKFHANRARYVPPAYRQEKAA
jgi:hypothetical protein